MKKLREYKINFIGWRRPAYAASVLVILGMIALTVVNGGLNYGIDFIGGTSVLLKFNRTVDVEFLGEIRSNLDGIDLGQNVRSIGGGAGGVDESKEIAVEVRGSDYVDNQTARFFEARSAKNGFQDPQELVELFPNMDASSKRQLLSYFTPQWIEGEGLAQAQYDLDAITEPQMRRIFQSIFNANIAATISDVLHRGLGEDFENRYDINAYDNGEFLARALAEKAAPRAAGALLALRGQAGDHFGSWEGVSALVRQNIPAPLEVELLPLQFSLADEPGRINLLTEEDPAVIAEGLVEPLAQGYLPLAKKIVDLRINSYNGILPTTAAVAESIPDLKAVTLETLQEDFGAGSFIILSTETVGPTVGKTLREGALWAVFYSLLGILIYVSFRFRFRYALAALAALVHDAAFIVFFFGATGKEFTIPVVAAVLTVIGYSLNDTIVVFDRIREKRGGQAGEKLAGVINTAVMDMMSRTLVTSSTTLVAVGALFWWGGAVIHNLCLALLLGIAVGTYSSIFISNPVLYELEFVDFSKLLSRFKKSEA